MPADADIAGQPAPDDVTAIEAGLAASVKTKSTADACIGRVSEPSIETAATSAAREACNRRELLVWTAALNRDFACLQRLLSIDREQQSLREIQRGFFLDELNRCTFERVIRNDSTTALFTATQYDVKSTALQDLWLMQQIDYLQPR